MAFLGSSITFINQQTVVPVNWLQDVNNLTYGGQFYAPTNTFSGNVTVAGTTTLGNLTAEGTTTLSGNVTVAGTTTLGTVNSASVLASNGNNVEATDGPGQTQLAFRNRLHNGSILISQRYGGTSQSLPASTAAPLADRWLLAVSGAATTMQVVNLTSAGGQQLVNAMQINGAAGVTNPQFQQRIESFNSRDLAGQAVVFSFWAFQNTGSALTVSAGVLRAGSTDLFTTTFSDVTLTVTPSTLPSGVWTQIVCKGTLSTAAITGVAPIVSFNGSLPAGSLIQATEFQFEPGTVNTPFEWRSAAYELAQCQRYFYAVTFAHMVAVAFTTTSLFFGHIHPVAMRAAPSLQVSVAFTTVQSSGGVSTSYTLASDAVTPTMAGYYLSGMNNGPTAAWQAARVQGGTMWWSAEL